MHKKFYIPLVSLFILIEVIFYVLIFTLSGQAVSVVSYLSIITAFVFGLIFIKTNKYNYLICLAMIFTLISDYFLVLMWPSTEQTQQIAMTTFSVAQLIYFAYILIKSKSKKLRLANIISRIILCIAMTIVTFVVCGDKVNYLAVISVFYYTNIALNLIFSLIQFKTFNLLAIGLVLFVLCDTVIGLNSAIGVFISVPETSILYKIAFAPFNLAWVFYLPSQVLIALFQSIRKKKES